MGAKIASEVAAGNMCKSTLASDFGTLVDKTTSEIIDCPTFRVQFVSDIAGAELCGTLRI